MNKQNVLYQPWECYEGTVVNYLKTTECTRKLSVPLLHALLTYLVIITLQWALQSSFSHQPCYIFVNFIHECRKLQFNVDTEKQIFEKLFMALLFIHRVFASDQVFVLFEMAELDSVNSRAFLSSKPKLDLRHDGKKMINEMINEEQWITYNKDNIKTMNEPK